MAAHVHVHEAVASFERHPSKYRHWKYKFEGEVATLSMDVQEDGGLRAEDYVLKQNSYDLRHVAPGAKRDSDLYDEDEGE